MAANYILLRLRRRAVVAPMMLLVTVLAIACALNGRTAYIHGVSRIPDNFVHLFDHGGANNFVQGILDFCQGIFVTAESPQVGGEFPEKYKVLAFSPLPSFIDGYDKIHVASQHRLHLYVPMSGVGEAEHFGWPFVCLLLGIYVLIARAHLQLTRGLPVVTLLCNFLLMASIYVTLTYPLRNGLRFAWLALLIAFIPPIWRVAKPRGRPGITLQAAAEPKRGPMREANSL
jgi:hypothetical protein